MQEDGGNSFQETREAWLVLPVPGSASEQHRKLGWKPQPCLGRARLLRAFGMEPQEPLGPRGGRKLSDLGVDPSWKDLSAGVRGSWTPQLLLGVRTGERKEASAKPFVLSQSCFLPLAAPPPPTATCCVSPPLLSPGFVAWSVFLSALPISLFPSIFVGKI